MLDTPLGRHIRYTIFNTEEKFVDKIFLPMRAGDEIGENFLLARILRCTIFSVARSWVIQYFMHLSRLETEMSLGSEVSPTNHQPVVNVRKGEYTSLPNTHTNG